MKNKLIIRYALVLGCAISVHLCFAQCINQNEIKTTDWAQINQTDTSKFPSLPNIVNTFDWTRPYYDGDVYVRNAFANPTSYSTRIHSPFSLSISNRDNPQMNSGINSIYDQTRTNKLDIYPADGWELLTLNMGSISSSGAVSPTSNPSFSIYNRRTGKIKFFMMFSKINGLSSIGTITIRNMSNADMSPLLNHADSMIKPLVMFDKGRNQIGPIHATSATLNEEPFEDNGKGLWVYAEFWTLFDPCACNPLYFHQFQFEIQTTQQMDVNLKIVGSIAGTNTPLLSSSAGLYDHTKSDYTLKHLIGTSQMHARGIVKSFKEPAQMGKDLKAIAETQKGIKITESLMKTSSKAFTGYGLLAFGAINLINHFIKASKKSETDPDNSAYKPTDYETNLQANLSATGTITNATNRIFITFAGPGRPNLPINDAERTIYNNPLGVFSVLSLPKLDWVEYRMTGFMHHAFTTSNIKQYKLNDQPIKYILNPASGLEITNIETQIIIKLKPTYEWSNYDPPFTGVFQFGESSTVAYCEGDDLDEKKINASGFQVVNWPENATRIEDRTIGTSFTSLNCVHNQTFLTNSRAEFDAYIKFHVKFKVIDKFGAISSREGETSNLDDDVVEYVVTYKLEINPNPIDERYRKYCLVSTINNTRQEDCRFGDGIIIPYEGIFNEYRSNFFLKQDDPSPWPNIDNKEHLALSLNINNTTLSGSQTFKALETIRVRNNVTVTSGSDIHLIAGKSIEIDDQTDFDAIIHADIGLDPNFTAGVCNDTEPYDGLPNLIDFCKNGGAYHTIATSAKKEDDLDTKKGQYANATLVINGLNPNPARDMATIHFTIKESADINILIYDINGKLIGQILNNILYDKGNFDVAFSVADLSPGIYLVKLQNNKGEQVIHKLVKQ